MHDWMVGASNATFGCVLLNEPKAHQCRTDKCNGLILWTKLNVLFIFQQQAEHDLSIAQ